MFDVHNRSCTPVSFVIANFIFVVADTFQKRQNLKTSRGIIAALRDFFDSIDANGSGGIDAVELAKALNYVENVP